MVPGMINNDLREKVLNENAKIIDVMKIVILLLVFEIIVAGVLLALLV